MIYINSLAEPGYYNLIVEQYIRAKPENFKFFHKNEDVPTGSRVLIVGNWSKEIDIFSLCKEKKCNVIFFLNDVFSSHYFLRYINSIGLLGQYIETILNQNTVQIAKFFANFPFAGYIVNNNTMKEDFLKAGLNAQVIPHCYDERLRDEVIIYPKLSRRINMSGNEKYIDSKIVDIVSNWANENNAILHFDNISQKDIFSPTSIPRYSDVIIGIRNENTLKFSIGERKLELNFSELEKRWKPVTKYSNALVQGLPFICLKEKSYLENQFDSAILFVEDFPNLESVLEYSLSIECQEYARSKERKLFSSKFSPQNSVKLLSDYFEKFN